MSLARWDGSDPESVEETMPTETRSLVFTPDEIAEALAEYRDAGHGRLPAGEIVYCRVGTAGPGVGIKVKAPALREAVSADIDAEDVGAALVAYCLARKIPLPRQASRSLEVQGSNLALRLSLNRNGRRLPDFFLARAARPIGPPA
jgi:hypothetical protein